MYLPTFQKLTMELVFTRFKAVGKVGAITMVTFGKLISSYPVL